MKVKHLVWATSLALGLAGNAAWAVEKMRFGHGLPEDHAVHKAIVKFADLVKERSNGEIEIKVFSNGVLGGERELLEQVQNGILEFTKASASPLETFSPQYKVFNLPFVFRDRAHFFKVLEGPVGESILASSKRAGFIGLAYYDSGARSFYGKKAVNTPDDLKGQKIRVQQSPTTIKMIQALGATPTPMAWGEVYPALQTGVVDGADNNVTALTNGRHGEVCKFFSETEHQMVPDVMIVSAARWNALKKPHQEIIKKAAVDSYEYQKTLWAAFEKVEREKSVAMGVKFNTPDKAAFVAKVRPMMAEESKNAVIGKLLAEIAAVK